MLTREIEPHEWAGRWSGAMRFANGGAPRVFDVRVDDEGQVYDATLVVGGDGAQIHWSRSARCPTCRHENHELRWVGHLLYDVMDDSGPRPTVEVAELLAFQLRERVISPCDLRRLGFGPAESG